jgi:hypothetical protein
MNIASSSERMDQEDVSSVWFRYLFHQPQPPPPTGRQPARLPLACPADRPPNSQSEAGKPLIRTLIAAARPKTALKPAMACPRWCPKPPIP